MPDLCSFSYAAFSLALIYAVLLVFVLKYLFNLIQQGTAKKQAQKAFLGILIAQTLRERSTARRENGSVRRHVTNNEAPSSHSAVPVVLSHVCLFLSVRVLYFTLYPFDSSACSPSMRGDEGEDVSGPAWWLHLLSNIPAVLFLMAFSVLVFTFARIYHKVLLAGIWFQERRFRLLTAVLVLLNVVALVATFGDWSDNRKKSGWRHDLCPAAHICSHVACPLSFSVSCQGLCCQ